MTEGEGFEPPVPFRVQRFSSSTVGSEALGKVSTLLLFSTAYKSVRLAPFCWEMIRFVHATITISLQPWWSVHLTFPSRDSGLLVSAYRYP
jgi:hypothetical protein